MTTYTAFYTEINLACIVLLWIHYSNTKKNMIAGSVGSRYKPEVLSIIQASIFTCVGDMCYGIVNLAPLEESRNFSAIFCHVYLVGTILIANEWLKYVEVVTDFKFVHSKLYRFIKAIPFAVYFVVALTNYWTRLLFTINEQNQCIRQDGIVILWTIIWIYLIGSAVVALIDIPKKRGAIRRRMYYPFTYYVSAPIITGSLQMWFSSYDLPIVQVGCVVLVTLMCTANQNYAMSTDKLTGIDNRYSLQRYKENLTAKSGEKQMLFFMIDLDGFKEINDVYGHKEGDKLLEYVAENLRTDCWQIDPNVFLCRYGGDEFLIVAEDKGDNAKKFVKLLTELFDRDDKDEKHVAVRASFGVARGKCGNVSEFEKLIMSADRDMYVAKAANHQAREDEAEAEARAAARAADLERIGFIDFE